jgi:hypothetical protein
MLGVAFTAVFVLGMSGVAEASWLAPQSGVDAWVAASSGSSACCAMIDLRIGDNVSLFASGKTFAASTTAPTPFVLYDIEPWTETPLAERQHPILAMRAFVALAHRRGEQAIISPSALLTRGAVGVCHPRSHEDPHETAFRCGLFSVHTDYLLVQSQRRECDAAKFAAWVKRVASVAKGPVIAELTVVWADPCVTSATIVASYRAALAYTSSFSLWYGCTDWWAPAKPCVSGTRDLASQARIGAQVIAKIAAPPP